MTAGSPDEMGTPEEVERLYSQFVGHRRPLKDPPEGFEKWVQNLDDVYLNVQAAWLASLFVPPSDIEQQLEERGGSRRQRLARFLARDMWVLWEAWDRRREYHGAFAERAPTQVARLHELESSGRSHGWFKRVRNIRDYMNHRDRRDYDDPGRSELPDDAIEWLDELRRTFSELLLAAMGIQIPRGEFTGTGDAVRRNSTLREIATRAADDLLTGTVAAMDAGAEGRPDATAIVAGHFGRAFTAAVCGSPQLWSECLTALIRRCVITWSRLGEVPQLRGLIESMDLEHDTEILLAAITTTPADGPELPLAELSRLAVHRAAAWFNGHGDLWATLAAAVSVAGLLASTAMMLEPEDLDIVQFIEQLGADADALLSDP